MLTTPSSSVGSDVFALASLLVISLLVLLLLRHYLPLRSTPAYLLVPVFLALALPCSIVLLVPVDLASAGGGDDDNPSRGVWLPERVLLVTWRITYWLTFALTWLILPLLGEYCDSGYSDTRSRIIYSLRSNARYQLIVLASGIAGLVYFVLTNGFTGYSIKGLVMALAYAWGLILAIGLMGHGLIALPRRLFKNASVSERLRRLQAQAPKTKDKLDDSIDQLEVLENTVMQLKQRKTGIGRDLQDWIDELADTSALPESRPGTTAAIRATNPSIPTVVTERYLADLTRKLKRARHKKVRFINEWANVCQQAQDTQTILDASSTRKLDFGKDRPSSRNFKLLNPTIRYHVHALLIPYSRIALSLILASASAVIIWSEVIKSFAPKLSVIGLTVVHHPNSETGKVGFAGQVIAALWLSYMDVCALYAVSDVRVWGNRALVKRQTYAESATWYALQVAKLTVPLSYNFVTMTPPEVYRDTQFYTFLGQLINLTPLGKGFSAFFPCFVLVPVLATLFNVYGKTKQWIGFGVLEDESSDNPSGLRTGGWREGRALIEREQQSRGGVAGNVGLGSVRSSLESRPTAAAGTSTLPVHSQPRSQKGSVNLSANVREANRQFNTITNQEEGDESPRHFYDDFTERLRNTFETAERPEWVQHLGGVFKTPQWMKSDQRDDSGGSGLGRWFGGRAQDGRVRL